MAIQWLTLVLALCLSWSPAPTPQRSSRGSVDTIASSSDVAWLEGVAASKDAALALWRSQDRPLGQFKDLRIAAYARLGALGTEASLDAAFRARPMISASASLTEKWVHPGWHMADYTPFPLAEVRSAGRDFVILSADLLGPPQLFLLRCEPGRRANCTRPVPLGPWSMRYLRVEATLTAPALGRLQLSITPKQAIRPGIMDGTAPLTDQPPIVPPPERRDFVLADIDQDTDRDGWTDIEERTLGLDPSRADSDGDGVNDAHDRSPLHAPPPAERQDKEAQILGQALFAVFGVVESPWVLLAETGRARSFQAWGLAGPVLFGHQAENDPSKGGPGGVFVTWTVVLKSETEAVVQISDWEGPLAAGGQDVVLRRLNGRWVVVSRTTTWIS
jgi:hypothetical protein